MRNKTLDIAYKLLNDCDSAKQMKALGLPTLQSLVDDIEKQIDSLTAPEDGVVDIDIEDFSVNDTN